MRLIFITILLLIQSCSSSSVIEFNVKFPKESKILNQKEKIELNKNIAIKNIELFSEEELKEMIGDLEIEIK